MFNITGLSDGAADLYLIKGQNSTFTEGMNFIFEGDKNYIDHIQATAPAYDIFTNNSPTYTTTIAHDAGTYKTIGSSFEFGGLADNTLNTKRELMFKYLEFFEFSPITESPGTPSGDDVFCGSGESGEYTTNNIEGADYYIWLVEPIEAGTVTGYDTDVSIQWNSDYEGENATVCVCGMNESGLGPMSDSLLVTFSTLPEASFELTTNEICQGESIGVSVQLTGVSPWTFTIQVGSFTEEHTINKPDPDVFYIEPAESTSFQIISVVDGSGCENTEVISSSITVTEAPAKTFIETGATNVDIRTITSSDYTASPAAGADTYQWTISPSNAGTTSSAGTSATINWSTNYLGNAQVSIYGINDCFDGEPSDAFIVNVYSSLSIDENTGISSMSLYPNPNNGNFTLELESFKSQNISIFITDPFGKKVVENHDVELNSSLSLDLSLENVTDGVYFLFIKTDNGTISQKIMIQK